MNNNTILQIYNELSNINNKLCEVWFILNKFYDSDIIATQEELYQWYNENSILFINDTNIDLGECIEKELMDIHQKISNILDDGEITELEAKTTIEIIDNTQNIIDMELNKLRNKIIKY